MDFTFWFPHCNRRKGGVLPSQGCEEEELLKLRGWTASGPLAQVPAGCSLAEHAETMVIPTFLK
jgi:hypothetical protein